LRLAQGPLLQGSSQRLQARSNSAADIAFGRISPRAAQLLARSEEAAASWQACLYDALRQGLPLSIAITLCEIRLWQDDKRGWGDAGIVNAVFKEPPPPPNVVGACGSGADPMRAGGNAYATVGDKTLESLRDALLVATAQVIDPATKADLAQQLEAIEKELDQRAKTGNSVKDVPKIEVQVGKVELDLVDGDAKNKSGAPRPRATIELLTDKIKVTPVQKPGDQKDAKGGAGTHRTFPEADCVQAVARAQEFLRECQRTGWKTGACQVFRARQKNCPDPRLAYVDPGSGYACGEAPDPKLVAEAYAMRCEALVRLGPDGRNPCRPQAAQLDARQLQGVKDLCNDPKAYTTGEGCVVELVVPSPTSFQRGGTVQEVIAIANTRLGGPIFVLPKPAPAPRGPQPQPGPRTQGGPAGTLLPPPSSKR
jgi:hypothetical protein